MPTIADGYQVLLDQLERSPQPESAKAAFRELILQQLNGALTEREQRVHFARHLLGLGTARSVIRERLQNRFGIERAQAYRDIDKALQFVPSI
jgi:DNA-directed RNA polymerase sigma subunit (sigma70/sigma32)